MTSLDYVAVVVAELISRDHGLAVVTTLRPDGAIAASVVNAASCRTRSPVTRSLRSSLAATRNGRDGAAAQQRPGRQRPARVQRDGEIADPGASAAMTVLLQDLQWWAQILRGARVSSPLPAVFRLNPGLADRAAS